MARVFGAHRRALMPWIVATACTAIAAPAILLAAFGWHHDRNPWLARAVFVVALAAVVVSVAAMLLGRYRVVVGADGVRVKGRRGVALGPPRKLRYGQYEVVAEKHAWIAVEDAVGTQVVFRTQRGLLQRPVYWPAGRPPETVHVFYGDVIALRDAIGEQIR